MDIVAHLPAALLSHLRFVLGRAHVLSAADDWAAVGGLLRTRSPDALVVDPRTDDPQAVWAIGALRERHPAVPVVVYTTLTPATLRAVVQLAGRGIEHVVLHRFDDEPRRFLALLEQLPGYALGNALLAAMAPSLARLPGPTARAIERMVRMPQLFSDVEDLAAAAGLSTRQLYRQLEEVGIRSPRWLVQGARLLRAFAYLQQGGCSIGEAARRLGYGQARVLARQLTEVAGCPASSVSDDLAPDVMVGLVSRKLRRA